MSEAIRLVDSWNRNTATTANSMAGIPSNFSQAGLKICCRCKKENPEDARYCLQCGLPLGSESPTTD
jgi:predicted amidophosphoribosyltransferase